MHRFRELTGLDLRRTEDIVTTWWLLKRRQSARMASVATEPVADARGDGIVAS